MQHGTTMKTISLKQHAAQYNNEDNLIKFDPKNTIRTFLRNVDVHLQYTLSEPGMRHSE